MKKSIFLISGIFLLLSSLIAISAAYTYYHPAYKIRPYRPVARSYSAYRYPPLWSYPANRRTSLPTVRMTRPVMDFFRPDYYERNNYQPNLYGQITVMRYGYKATIMPTATTVQNHPDLRWEWNYDSRAVNCDITSENHLNCWRVQAHLPAEIYADFYITDEYGRNQSFRSNEVNL